MVIALYHTCSIELILPPAASMINLSNVSVIDLSEAQMNSLVGLKFSEAPTNDPNVRNLTIIIIAKYDFIVQFYFIFVLLSLYSFASSFRFFFSPIQTISRDRLPSFCRVILPGSMATMDFRQDRLNLRLDFEGKVKEVNRG